MAAAGWLWFGAPGAVALLLWWWLRRPGAAGGAETDGWEVDLSRVRSARLGRWRTRIQLTGKAPLEIFHDELSGADLARLRRELKRQLAAGFSTSRRSEKPGNRIVSSERGRVSG